MTDKEQMTMLLEQLKLLTQTMMLLNENMMTLAKRQQLMMDQLEAEFKARNGR